jgi:hypothetical protein
MAASTFAKTLTYLKNASDLQKNQKLSTTATSKLAKYKTDTAKYNTLKAEADKYANAIDISTIYKNKDNAQKALNSGSYLNDP